jgi:hypothetical protein
MTLLGVLEAKCKWIILGKVFLWGINFWVHILQHEQDYIEGLGSPKSEVLCGACKKKKLDSETVWRRDDGQIVDYAPPPPLQANYRVGNAFAFFLSIVDCRFTIRLWCFIQDWMVSTPSNRSNGWVYSFI